MIFTHDTGEDHCARRAFPGLSIQTSYPKLTGGGSSWKMLGTATKKHFLPLLQERSHTYLVPSRVVPWMSTLCLLWLFTAVANHVQDIPLTIVYGDLGAGNIAVAAGGPTVRLLDWGDTLWGGRGRLSCQPFVNGTRYARRNLFSNLGCL